MELFFTLQSEEMARHSQRLVAIVMMINYNCGADLSWGIQIGHARMDRGSSSMAAPIQLGKSPFSQEYRLIEPPLGAVITSRAFSLFCRTPFVNKWYEAASVEEKALGLLTSRPRRIADARETINRQMGFISV